MVSVFCDPRENLPNCNDLVASLLSYSLSCFSTEYTGNENDNETLPETSAGCWSFFPTVLCHF